MKAAADATEEAAESESEAAVAAAAIDGKLRDLEVLTMGSDPINKTSEAADTEQTTDKVAELVVCPLVATMVGSKGSRGSKDRKREGSSSSNRGGNNNNNSRGSEVAKGPEDRNKRDESSTREQWKSGRVGTRRKSSKIQQQFMVTELVYRVCGSRACLSLLPKAACTIMCYEKKWDIQGRLAPYGSTCVWTGRLVFLL